MREGDWLGCATLDELDDRPDDEAGARAHARAVAEHSRALGDNR